MACHTIERRPLELCKELALAGGKSLGASPPMAGKRSLTSRWEEPSDHGFPLWRIPKGKGPRRWAPVKLI